MSLLVPSNRALVVSFSQHSVQEIEHLGKSDEGLRPFGVGMG